MEEMSKNCTPWDCTLVGENINKMKTTLELNFDLQLFKQYGYIKLGNKEKLSIQKASL